MQEGGGTPGWGQRLNPHSYGGRRPGFAMGLRCTQGREVVRGAQLDRPPRDLGETGGRKHKPGGPGHPQKQSGKARGDGVEAEPGLAALGEGQTAGLIRADQEKKAAGLVTVWGRRGEI